MSGVRGEHMPESEWKRSPDESDDLDAIVRYHGANEVIDALLRAASDAYGEDAAQDNLMRLTTLRADRLFSPASTGGDDA